MNTFCICTCRGAVSEENKKNFLFATEMRGRKGGKAPNMKHPNNWLKQNILKEILTEEELAGLTPKCYRKGFSNWAEMHPNPRVQAVSQELKSLHEKYIYVIFR